MGDVQGDSRTQVREFLADKAWVFVLEDESVGFKAVGGVFGWRRGYDLLEHRSLLPQTP